MKKQSLFLTLFAFQTILGLAQNKTSVQSDLLTYKSGICYGTCPIINCIIEKNSKIKIDRIILKTRDDIDTSKSGSYIGKLTRQERIDFVTFLKDTTLITKANFPNVDCCDNPMQTIIIKRSGKESHFRSMFPQNKALAFIEFLNRIALRDNLIKIGYDESLFEKLEVPYLKPKLHSSSEEQNNNHE